MGVATFDDVSSGFRLFLRQHGLSIHSHVIYSFPRKPLNWNGLGRIMPLPNFARVSDLAKVHSANFAEPTILLVNLKNWIWKCISSLA